MKDKIHQVLNSISRLHAFLKLKKLMHPLICVIKAEELDVATIQIKEPVIFNFGVSYLNLPRITGNYGFPAQINIKA